MIEPTHAPKHSDRPPGPRVAVVDYGLGNLRSAVNALTCFGLDLTVAETGAELAGADIIVVPGVGSFDSGMRGLRERGHVDALNQLVQKDGVRYLGICLGMQFLFETSQEGSETGLGWLPGEVQLFSADAGAPKVPNIGWNEVAPVEGKRLFSDLEPPYEFYFVHSYFVPLNDNITDNVAATAHHGHDYAAAIERDNLFAVQFHPEKSQLAGMKLLETVLTLT